MLDNDDEIWQILAGRSDAKLDNTSDFFERENRIYLAFTEPRKRWVFITG